MVDLPLTNPKGLQNILNPIFIAVLMGELELSRFIIPSERGFINSKSISGKIIGKKGAKALVVNATGLSEYRYDAYKENEDYFKELCEQYEFLVFQGKSPCGDFAYKVVNNYDSLTKWLSQDKNNLAIIVTIEGAHVFGCGLMVL